MSKAIAVVVPPIWLLYDLKIRKDKPAEAIAKQVVPIFLCACLVFITLSAQSSVYGGIRKHMELGIIQILGIDAMVLWRYVAMLVAPTGLSVLYDPPLTGVTGPIVFAVSGWLLVGAVIWKFRNRCPWLFLSAASFLLFLLPVLNLKPISTLMNDRYLYLPSIPFIAMIVLGWDRLFEFAKARISDFKPFVSHYGFTLLRTNCGSDGGCCVSGYDGENASARLEEQSRTLASHGKPRTTTGCGAIPTGGCVGRIGRSTRGD